MSDRVKIGDTIETTCEHGLPGFLVLRATVTTQEAVALAQRLVDEERWRIVEQKVEQSKGEQ